MLEGKMSDQNYLTDEGALRLKNELERLKGTERKILAKRLREAIQMGDLSENADYHKAKEDQGFLEGRIQELELLLQNAVIVDTSQVDGDTVQIGTTVTVQEEDYPPEKFYLVGAKEADPRSGRISNESPVGNALLGKKVGDAVVVKTPNGSVNLKILNIE
jgi:transcription elongation factor GreA